MTTSLRATACAICKQDLEPAQRWRCEVCPDYEVCGPCYSNGIINHPHTLISPPSPTGQVYIFIYLFIYFLLITKCSSDCWLLQLRAVLLHVTTCCTTQCQYPRCRTVKLLLRHGVTCKKRVCNHCKRMWDIFRMHARNCREPQCTIPKCRYICSSIRKKNKVKMFFFLIIIMI